jgi:hypothetical protein
MPASLNSARGGSAQYFQGCDCTKYGLQCPTPTKIQDHDEPHIAHHNHIFAPSQFENQKCMVAGVESTTPAVAVPWDIGLLYVPPGHTVWDAHLRIKADASMLGLTFSIVAFAVDPALCSNGSITLGATVAAAVPTAFAGVSGATSATLRGAVNLASGGYYTGSQGLMYSLRVTAVPSGVGSKLLSEITGQIGLVLKVSDYMDQF